MVAMDPDSEFNALSALYQSVVTDMKSSYPAWEMVGQRAQKLAAQLKATIATIAAFNDAVQQVSDLANNLKGASRDVGACVTRICMRQRALEGRLKSVADSLSDELAVTVVQRTAFWKQRTHDIDKNAAKHLKKVRSRKGRPDEASVTTQKAICGQLLAEQRAQFAFFVSALLPVLTAEVSLLDEASHIRPSVESLEGTLKHVDGDALVHTILSDLTQGAESAWRTCLASAGASYCSSASSEDGQASRLVSPTMGYPGNDNGSGDMDLTPQQNHNGMTVISRQSMCTNSSVTSTNCVPRLQLAGKPPLVRRLSVNSNHPSTPSSHHSEQGTPHVPSLSSFRGSYTETRQPMRPHSLTGEARGGSVNGGGTYATPLPTPIHGTPPSHHGYGTISHHHSGDTSFENSSSFSVHSSGCGDSSTGAVSMGGGNGHLMGREALNSASCSSSEAASMIAETLQQIDRLGSELETFCSNDSATARSNGGQQMEYASSDVVVGKANSINGMMNRSDSSNGPIRVRPDSSRPPAPPERRSSHITCATPNAPSVAEARLSMTSSLRGSRQSLNSNTSYDGNSGSSTHGGGGARNAPYTLVSAPSAYNHNTLRQQPGHYAAPNVNPYAAIQRPSHF